MVFGAPRLRSTRIYLSALVRKLEEETPQEIVEGYSALENPPTTADVTAALRYCAERQCRAHAIQFCHNCVLRRVSDGMSFEEYSKGIETLEDGLDMASPGVKFLGSAEQLRQEWQGWEFWKMAQDLLARGV